MAFENDLDRLIGPHAVELAGRDDQLTSLLDDYQASELQSGLTMIAASARVPEEFAMIAQSQPGLSIELHFRGRSRTDGVSHPGAIELTQSVAGVICATQPERWRTSATAGDDISLYTLLVSSDWLERHGFAFGVKSPHRLEHLRTWRVPVEQGLVGALHDTVRSGRASSPLVRLARESVALRLLGTVLGDGRDEPPPIDARTTRRAHAARDYLATTTDPCLTIEAMARALATSPRQLQRDFQATFALSPFAFLRRHRLERAAAALRAGETDVTGAALGAGYDSPSAFARAMRKTLGIVPRELRR